MPEVKRKRREDLFSQAQFAKDPGLSEYGSKSSKKKKKTSQDHDVSLTDITNMKLEL